MKEIKNYALDNLISMMKEFDYEKNGKNTTIYFLAQMIQYFNEIDDWV